MDQQVLQRLRRLEERFRGNGVTEGEADPVSLIIIIINFLINILINYN